MFTYSERYNSRGRFFSFGSSRRNSKRKTKNPYHRMMTFVAGTAVAVDDPTGLLLEREGHREIGAEPSCWLSNLHCWCLADRKMHPQKREKFSVNSTNVIHSLTNTESSFRSKLLMYL